MGVYVHCRYVYLSTKLYICNHFSDFARILAKMRDLTEFEKGQIVGAGIAGAWVAKTAERLGFSRATISRPMAELKKYTKTSRNRSNSGLTFNFFDRARSALRRSVERKHRTTAAKVTAELNQHLNSPVSVKTARRELIKPNIMEKPPSGNLRFTLSKFKRGWSGVEITRACSTMEANDILRLQCEFMDGGCPEKLTTLKIEHME